MMVRDILYSTFVLCFTRFERHPGDAIDDEECVKFCVLYCVSHALSDTSAAHLMARDMLDSAFVLCFTCFSDIRVTPLMARDVLNSTFVLCFTCFERHPGDAIDAEGCARFNVCIMFCML